MMAKKHEILLSVSDEQESAIRELFGEKKWEYSNLCMYCFLQFCLQHDKCKCQHAIMYDFSFGIKPHFYFSADAALTLLFHT